MDADLAPTTPSTDEQVAAHLTRRPDLDLVTDWLATGGDLHWDEAVARADLDGLLEHGVTHILDLRQEWSDEAFVALHAPHVRYVHLGVDDAGQRMPDEWFEAGIALAGRVRDAGGLVLAHCHMGINRGPSMAFALLLADGWAPAEALERIRSVRPIAGIGYATDALDHHHRHTGASVERRAADRRAVAEWFQANHLDVATIIRGIRRAEGGTAFN